MSRYYFVISFALCLTFIGGISTKAQEVDILSESVLVDALEKGCSLIITDVLSIKERGERSSEVKVKVVQPIIFGDLTEEDFEGTLDFFTSDLYSKNLQIGSRYALFVIKNSPCEYSWAHRNDFQLIDKSDSHAVEELIRLAKNAYAKTSLSKFRQNLLSIEEIDLSSISDEILSLCEQFKADPENRSLIGEKIYLSDIGSRTKNEIKSSIREYLRPKISLSRSQILSLFGRPTIKCGWTYSWLCGQPVERGPVDRDVYVLSITFNSNEKVIRLLYQQQKKDKWTKLQRCVNKLYGLAGQPESVLLGFQKVLQKHNWKDVLSFCSENVHEKAQEYESLEKFFCDFLPIEELDKMKQFPTAGYSGNSDGIYRIDLELHLSVSDHETFDLVRWEWSLVRNKEKWLIDFKIVPVEIMVKKELLRRKLRDEDYETRCAKFEKGIKYNLIPLREDFVIGKPMSFRIEMKNISDVPILYKTIGPLMINDPMNVIGPDGEKVRYVDMISQTLAGQDVILPGETIVFVEDYDATSQYYITVPGRYSFQFKRSNTIEVEVKQGDMSAQDDIYTQLLNILPQGWTITRRLTSSSEPYLFVDKSDAYIIVHMIGKRRGIQIDVDIRLAIVDDDSSSLDSKILSECQVWGKCKWGNIYSIARDAETLWPDYRDQIEKALEIE